MEVVAQARKIRRHATKQFSYFDGLEKARPGEATCYYDEQGWRSSWLKNFVVRTQTKEITHEKK